MPLSIKRVVPLESFKLIIEFDDGSFSPVSLCPGRGYTAVVSGVSSQAASL